MTMIRIYVIEYITEKKIIRGRQRTYGHPFAQCEYSIIQQIARKTIYNR